MKKILTLAILAIIISANAAAHSGRTDKKGGHNCSQKSKDKGLCSGYHYHDRTSTTVKKQNKNSNNDLVFIDNPSKNTSQRKIKN